MKLFRRKAKYGRPRFAWMTGLTARDREIGIEVGGCSGSPNCYGAIHIRRVTSIDGWQEIHLTKQEIRTVIALLEESIAMRDAGVDVGY